MTKAPLGGRKTGPNPTNRGKGGVKRSLLTDAQGIPLAIVIDGANRHDMKLARPTPESLEVERPSLLAVWPQGLCLDKGYDYAQIQQLAVALGYRSHIHSRCDEAHQRQAGNRARRWVVERTHIWLNRFRGLRIRWAKKAKNISRFFIWPAASSLGGLMTYWDRLQVVFLDPIADREYGFPARPAKSL